MFVPQVLRFFAHYPRRLWDSVAKTVAFKQEHGKKAELPCPDAKQGEECPLRTKLGYLSTQTWDREFGGLGCQ
jgi:hypothetical protein